MFADFLLHLDHHLCCHTLTKKHTWNNLVQVWVAFLQQFGRKWFACGSSWASVSTKDGRITLYNVCSLHPGIPWVHWGILGVHLGGEGVFSTSEGDIYIFEWVKGEILTFPAYNPMWDPMQLFRWQIALGLNGTRTHDLLFTWHIYTNVRKDVAKVTNEVQRLVIK